MIAITTTGRKALRQWIAAGVDIELISSVTDPIRSRIFFLDVLSTAKRLEYLDQQISATESYLATTTEYLDREQQVGDAYECLGSLGAVKITAARLEWLREVRKQVARLQRD